MGGGRPGFGTGTKFHPGTPVKKIGGLNPDEATNAILRWSEKVESREKLLDILVPYIKLRGVQFLDQWLTQAISAKSDAGAPPEEESQVHWAIALIGNLLWAASCFIPGAGVIQAPEILRGALLVQKAGGPMTNLGKSFYATMQVGGSLLAAGTTAQMQRQIDQMISAAGPDGLPNGKDVIAIKLNEQRKKLEKQFGDSITSFAEGLTRYEKFQPETYERDRVKFLDAVDRALWASIFPDIEYGDLTSFYRQALSKISTALGQFREQYKTWSEARLRYAQGDPHPRYGGSDWSQTRFEEYEKRVPFRPQLHLI